MVVVDGRGVSLGDYLHSASPAEVRLAETTLAAIRVGRRHRAGRPRQKPVRVIADKAYDSDPLRERLARRGIERIAPHRSHRKKPATQDGRALRRYKRRWIIERTNAWLGELSTVGPVLELRQIWQSAVPNRDCGIVDFVVVDDRPGDESNIWIHV
jgi:transposase